MKIFATDLRFPGSTGAAAGRQLPVRRDGSAERGWITRSEHGWHVAHAWWRRPAGRTDSRATAMARSGSPRPPSARCSSCARTAKSEVIADARAGEPFLFLNDLAFAPNGDLYLTDSGVELEELAPGGELNPDYRKPALRRPRLPHRHQDRAQVELRRSRPAVHERHRLRPRREPVRRRDADREHLPLRVPRWTACAERASSSATSSSTSTRRSSRGPDGMKFGADGNLYVAVFGQGDITVLDREGEVRETHQDRGYACRPTSSSGRAARRRSTSPKSRRARCRCFDVGTDGFPLSRLSSRLSGSQRRRHGTSPGARRHDVAARAFAARERETPAPARRIGLQRPPASLHRPRCRSPARRPSTMNPSSMRLSNFRQCSRPGSTTSIMVWLGSAAAIVRHEVGLAVHHRHRQFVSSAPCARSAGSRSRRNAAADTLSTSTASLAISG